MEEYFQYLRLLDVFPKTVDDAKEPSVSGGGVSIVVFLLLSILFVSEVVVPMDYMKREECDLVGADFNVFRSSN